MDKFKLKDMDWNVVLQRNRQLRFTHPKCPYRYHSLSVFEPNAPECSVARIDERTFKIRCPMCGHEAKVIFEC